MNVSFYGFIFYECMYACMYVSVQVLIGLLTFFQSKIIESIPASKL